METQEDKPVLSYVNLHSLTYENEGGCAALCLGLGFMPIISVYLTEILRMDRKSPLLWIVVIGLWAVPNVVGLWLGVPIFRRKHCPVFQYLMASIGTILNTLWLVTFVIVVAKRILRWNIL